MNRKPFPIAARIAGWLRALADWWHPASRQPCVLLIDAERAYIDGVQYIAWRIAQERMSGVDIDRVHRKPAKPAKRTTKRTKGATKP